MEVRVGDIAAKCACGSKEYVPSKKPPLCGSDLLMCANCGRVQTYAALLDGIGDEAIRRSRTSLKKLRGKPR